MQTHTEAVNAQFDVQAQAYLSSAVHAQGPDLVRAQALVAAAIPPTGRILDVGCGAGHLSFALAPSVSQVIALDSSPNMLTTVATAAADKGLPQIETRAAQAEALPFADNYFCVAATRYSAHHWTQLDRAVAEMYRVLKPGGYLLLIDVLGHEDALVDTHLQTFELLRDRSHVRNRSASDWQTRLGRAGFTDLNLERFPLRLEFASWVARMRTPAERIAMIRDLQQTAPREVQTALAIEADGSFSVETGLFWARKPR